MKKRTSIIAIIIAILVLGVGYAAISNITLNLNTSTATMAPSDSNFSVVYDVVGNMSCTGDGTGTFTRTDDTHVSFEVTGMTKKDDSVVCTIPFKNMSETLKAQMADANLTNSNSTYFSVSAASLSSVKLNEKDTSGSSANLVVTITALKTPVDDNESTTITGTLVASPANS